MRDPHPGLLDRVLQQLDHALRVVAAPATAPSDPARGIAEADLDDAQRRHAAGLMRINHAGEVCAQALYHGHAAASHSPQVKAHLLHAADEEHEPLAWCAQRLQELDSRPSLLNPLWYAGAYVLGYGSARLGDAWGLGFVVETERQVESHLHDHLQHLPAQDARSRAIVAQMEIDERRHGEAARGAGGRELPWPIPALMQRMADILRAIAYRI